MPVTPISRAPPAVEKRWSHTNRAQVHRPADVLYPQKVLQEPLLHCLILRDSRVGMLMCAVKATACRAPSTAHQRPEHLEQGPQQLCQLAPTSLESRDLFTYRKVTVQMVTEVEHLGPPPACQPQKIKEVTLQVKGAQRETWVQAKCLQPHGMVQGSQLSSAVSATRRATWPHADVSPLMRHHPAPPHHHPNPEVSVLPHLRSLSSHVTTPLFSHQLFSGYRQRQKPFRPQQAIRGRFVL